MGPLLAGLGSPIRCVTSTTSYALMDGLVGNQLVSPSPDFDPSTAVTAMLRGLTTSHAHR